MTAQGKSQSIPFGSYDEKNLGIIPLVFGIIAALGVLVIKFVGPRPFLGIENPSGTYGNMFLLGLGGGIILFVVGMIVMAIPSLRKEKEYGEPLEEFEEEEIEEEFVEEEVELGICPTCGAEIPIDSTKCPECGELLEPYGEEEEFYVEEEVEEEEETIEEIVEETIECPICGAELSSDTKTCPECGEPLGEEEEEEEDMFSDL